MYDPPTRALALWDAVRRERNATYVQETRREQAHDYEQAAADVEGGGYEGVALALMAAIARDEPVRRVG